MVGRVGVREGVSELVWAVSVEFWVWLSWSSFPTAALPVLCLHWQLERF